MAISKEKERVVSGRLKQEEKPLDLSLRPKRFSQYPGQEKVKQHLKILIQAAQKRNEPVEHILLYGPAGIGKTTLASIIASEAGVKIRVTSGPAIERPGDLASIITNLEDGEILFVDEIHRLNRVVEEILYPAMEDYALDIILGKGPSAKTMRLDLPKFTMIGATTRIGLLSTPLRDRFGVIHKLDFYSIGEIKKIILRTAKVLHIGLKNEAAAEVARASRRTPRIANRLMKRIRDYAEVNNQKVIDLKTAQAALKMLEIDQLGLEASDRHLLKMIIEKFQGGPVGLDTLAAATSEDPGNIEEVYEPYLLRLGMIKRTPRGRVATKAAYNYLGYDYEAEEDISEKKIKSVTISKNQERLL